MKFSLRHEPEPAAVFELDDWQNVGSRMNGMREESLRERIRELERRLKEQNPSLPSADPETGLGNGGYLWLEARKLVATFERTGQAFTLVVIDAGDTGPAFSRLRDVLLTTSRKQDTIGLLGGPFFGVLVMGGAEDAGRHFIDRIANADSWRSAESLRPHPPVFGQATWSAALEGSLEALLEAAEADMRVNREALLYQAANPSAKPSPAPHMEESTGTG